jgi:hypothetical protein
LEQKLKEAEERAQSQQAIGIGSNLDKLDYMWTKLMAKVSHFGVKPTRS